MKMCCRTLHDCTPETVRELYKDVSRTVDFGDVRFERLCLDDTYTHSKTKKLVCSLCRRLHKLEDFTEGEVSKDPTERVCEASQRLLDLTPCSLFGPGISFTCEQLLRSRNLHLPLPLPYDQGFTFRPVDDDTRQWTILMAWTFPMEYPLPSTWVADLRYLLDSFPVYICPHLTSSEPNLLRAIIAHYKNCLANPPFVICLTCDTKVEFTMPNSQLFTGITWTPTRGVSFRAARRIGKLGESAVDARWKAQSLPLPLIRGIEGGSREDLVLLRDFLGENDGDDSILTNHTS